MCLTYNCLINYEVYILNMFTFFYFIFYTLFYFGRNLSKPIAVQSKEKEDRYVDNYRVLL